MSNIQLKFEMIVRKIAFVKADLQYHKVEHSRRRQIFYDDLQDYVKNRKFEFSEEKMKKNLIDVYERKRLIPVPDISKQNKKIFRQIAAITHPDKVKNELKKDSFLKAREAIENDDWFSLYQMGFDLGIELPDPTAEQIAWMEQEVEKLEVMINKVVSTIEWIYCNEGSNKDHLLTSYCMATCTLENE